MACHQDAAPEIRQTLSSFPIFRYARYLDNKTNRLPGDRYYGFISHSIRQLKALWPLLNQQTQYDLVFSPTVMLHHLLAWWVLMTFHPKKPRHLTLFFVTNPGIWNPQSKTATFPKSAFLLGSLLKLFRRQVEQGKVTLAVETGGAQQEFEALAHMPFTLMPHPVPNSATNSVIFASTQPLNFACYGFARYEKGSDLLKSAIKVVLAKQPDFSSNFSLQWIDPFMLPNGSSCHINDLQLHPKVTVIDRPLMPIAYQQLLDQTSCMILPYRNSSYYARVSRVAIESAYRGIPIIYTKGGWLEEVVLEFGVGIGIKDESVENLVEAINQMNINYSSFRQQAMEKRTQAQQYFSSQNFCQQLLRDSFMTVR
ncbi:MAG: glycosyltransferase [Cyanobacteria bacterium J06560_6]